MNNSIIHNGLAANIRVLHHLLTRAMNAATTACQDLENDQMRAAVGAVIPIAQALQDAASLVDAVLMLNREIE